MVSLQSGLSPSRPPWVIQLHQQVKQTHASNYDHAENQSWHKAIQQPERNRDELARNQRSEDNKQTNQPAHHPCSQKPIG
jgi:hypothetical protein